MCRRNLERFTYLYLFLELFSIAKKYTPLPSFTTDFAAKLNDFLMFILTLTYKLNHEHLLSEVLFL